MAAATAPRAGGPAPLRAATLRVVAEEGVGAVTVRRVAAAAGVSPGTITHHFGSVDALLVAALEDGASAVVAELEHLALDLQDEQGDPAAWAAAFAAALAHSLRTAPERHVACFELQLMAVRRPELRAAATRVADAYRRLGRSASRAAGAADPAAGGTALVAMCTGLVLVELAAQDGGTEGRLRELLAAQLEALART